MLISNHVLIGAAVGSLVRQPAAAFTVGTVSHFVADALPHWGDYYDDYDSFIRFAVKDGLVGLGLMSAITVLTPSDRRPSVFMGMLGSCFPDANKPGRLFFGRSPFPQVVDRFHSRIQDESPKRLKAEVAAIILGSVAAGLLLKRARR